MSTFCHSHGGMVRSSALETAWAPVRLYHLPAPCPQVGTPSLSFRSLIGKLGTITAAGYQEGKYIPTCEAGRTVPAEPSEPKVMLFTFITALL